MKVLQIQFSIEDFKGEDPVNDTPEGNFSDLQNKVYGDLGFYQKFHNVDDIIEDPEKGTITLITLLDESILKKSEDNLILEKAN